MGVNLLERFSQPPVTLMTNGSSSHGAPALLADLQQGLANLNVSALQDVYRRDAASFAPSGSGADRGTNASAGMAAAWPPRPGAEGYEATVARLAAAAAAEGEHGRRSVVLRVTNHPLPLTRQEQTAIDTFLSVLAAIFVLVPFCYLAGELLAAHAMSMSLHLHALMTSNTRCTTHHHRGRPRHTVRHAIRT